MWSVVLFVLLSCTCVYSQRNNSRHGNGWDIRLAVPGEPGSDYPTLNRIPRTTFTCSGKAPGYYADEETKCQAFRVCTVGSTYGFQSFLCPNGTVFNQAVMVCDWWMNVNCEKTQQYIKTNEDKFGNLKLGPQLMKDIKKMITHPMRNPYDKSAMKSNQIVMQEYRPPSGQMFSNTQQTPSAKLVQQNFINGNSISDTFAAASTSGPLYIGPNSNFLSPAQENVEFFQKQQQNGQYFHQTNGQYVQQPRFPNNQNGKYFNGAQSSKYVQNNHNHDGQAQNGQLTTNSFRQNEPFQSNNQQTHSGTFISNNQPGNVQSEKQNIQYSYALQPTQTQNYNQGNTRQNQQQVFNNNAGYQRAPIRQSAQYTDMTINPQLNTGKPTEFGVSFSRQQYTANQQTPNNAYQTTLPRFSTDIPGKVGIEAKQNLVSSSFAPPTIIAKTVKFNRIIQEPKPGAPKSRITFKTWIVKQPAKTAKLIQAEPTAYTYDRPTNSPSTENIIIEPTPYYYSKPTAVVAQTQEILSEPDPYYYNPPTVTSQTEKLISEPDGYAYSRPTTAAKQIISTVSPTVPSRLYLTPSQSPPPTVASRLYLPPTTYKPLARLYLPASPIPQELSRQYLGPNEITQSGNLRSAKLQASPTTPTQIFNPPNNVKPTNSLIKKPRFNFSHNNLTFTDILTKEKLDNTVNDIVKDTRNILGTAQPGQQFVKLQEEERKVDYFEDNYLTHKSESFTESVENVSPTRAAPKQELLKSSKLVQPAPDLLPPLKSHENVVQTTNKLANLPFFKETAVPTKTIERTVSLKISIPEKTAQYLFNTSNGSDFDKLEILNTGSSNYLVLTNKLSKNPTAPSFIPIGKLIVDKDSNLSDSQALVFSFLADSINQAKDIAQQNALTSTTQFQNINNDELTKITNNVAQLTSSQYAPNNFNKQNQANHVSSTQNTNFNNQLRTSAKYTSTVSQNQAPQLNNAQTNSQQNFQGDRFISSRFQGGLNSINANLRINNGQNQLYSGQLYQVPVPDVTSIYNGQSSDKLIAQNNIRQQNNEVEELHQNTINNNNFAKQSSAEVEIIQSQTLPLPSPAKLQNAPDESQSFNSQEEKSLLGNFVNPGNGIAAEFRDKIIGTIPHPLEENKIVGYQKDQSYYVYTELDNNLQKAQSGNIIHQNNGLRNAKLTQSSNADNNVAYQLIPSVSYQLENEKDQQRLLNDFQIDEFGNPKGTSGKNILTSNVDYTVKHTTTPTEQIKLNSPINLYAGPSSYSAPQASVGQLETLQKVVTKQNSNAAKLELEDNGNNGYNNNNNGYYKENPGRPFNF